MKNKGCIEIIVILNLLFPACVFAETVILKSGKEVQGKIVEQTGDYIKIDVQGSPVYYERKYLKSIKKDNPAVLRDSPVVIEDSPVVNRGDSYLKRGLKFASEGKFKEAEEELKKGLEMNPSDHNLQETFRVIADLKNGLIQEEYALHLFKGSHHLMNAEYHPAIAEFKKALKAKSDDLDLYYYLGVSNYSLGRYDEAITYLSKISESKPDAEVYYYLGASYYSLGKHLEAIDYMERLLKISPDDPEAYSIIGTSKYLMGQKQQAKEAFVKAINQFKDKGDYLKAMDIEEFLGKLN